jgi:hypothetical protein
MREPHSERGERIGHNGLAGRGVETLNDGA